MKLVTFQHGSRRALGAVAGDAVVDLQAAYAAHLAEAEGDPHAAEIAAVRIPAAMTSFIAGLEPSWQAAEQALAHGSPSYPLADVRLLAPLVPPIILNSGQNYWDHRDEKPAVEQHDPEFFLKAPLGVIGPDDPVILDPVVTRKLDYEVELGVVIGKPGRHIPLSRPSTTSSATRSRTTSRLATARRSRTPRAASSTALGPGKNFDTCAPIGPWIVTRDEIDDPQSLGLRTYVNGELRQSNTTAKMIWDVATLVSFFSDFYTLRPGVLIETGTPGGTAWATDPEIGGKPYDRGRRQARRAICSRATSSPSRSTASVR